MCITKMIQPCIYRFITRCRFQKMMNNHVILIALLIIIKLPRLAAIGSPLALLIFTLTLYNAVHFKEGFPLIRADRTVIVSV
jgi:hypothetical protein